MPAPDQKVNFFKNQEAFRRWLEKNHQSKKELLVGYYKTGTGKASMSWSESVDQALCFGWIDGVRRSIDAESYQIRFTPRRPDSIWSAVNIAKIKVLSKKGLMRPAGLAVYNKRKAHKSEIYAHERVESEFSVNLEKHFKSNKAAWTFFQSLAPSYRKLSKNLVMGAKQESTRLKRLDALIKEFEKGINPWREHKYAGKNKSAGKKTVEQKTVQSLKSAR